MLTLFSSLLLVSCNNAKIKDDKKEISSEIEENEPKPIGLWEINNYTDEFGEKSSEKFLLLSGEGEFSNSATSGSRMTALLFVSKSERVWIRLIEYDSYIVKNDNRYECKIKDSEGIVHDFLLHNEEEYGDMYIYEESYENTEKESDFISILKKGGIVTFSIKEKYAYSTPDKYLFKMDVTGFEEAFKQL